MNTLDPGIAGMALKTVMSYICGGIDSDIPGCHGFR